MFSLQQKAARLCDGISRRELLRIGGLGLWGLSLPGLLEAQARAATEGRPGSVFGRARNVIFLWLQGGPPQHETWDPKPDAPAEIRGEFRPIATNVPGIYFSELLPRTAAIADKLAIVRSICTNNDSHSDSAYHVLTGYPYQGNNSRQISPNDWPYLGSVLRLLKPSERMPAYTSVWLPDVMRLNENVTPAGQTAGFLGRRWDPERIICDPTDPSGQVENFRLRPEIPAMRLNGRQRLLEQVDRHFRNIDRSGALEAYSQQVRDAFGILSSGRALRAFDMSQEPERIRRRYGRTKWGQCVLLARRLIEAGVRLVHVNWTRDEGDSAVDNPMWDTHALNSDRLQDNLCPQFDIGFPALIDDLAQRGLLDETLVVAIGEFGRTPRINAHAGRDHWGNVFSFAMAGAGIRTAQVYGASDRIGGHPRIDRVTPEDFTATVYRLLGIDHDGMFRDRAERPFHLTRGTPLYPILGTEPATARRQPADGNIALVPPYTDDRLFNTSFEDAVPLAAAGSSPRLRGWQAAPLLSAAEPAGFGVRVLHTTAPLPGLGWHHAALGFWSRPNLEIAPGTKAVLAQEIRNARAGRYRFAIQACGAAPSRQAFEELFLNHFSCRLVIFRFGERTKNPLLGQPLASLSFAPRFQEADTPRFERFELNANLDSPSPGVNFTIGLGLGVAVFVERSGSAILRPAADAFLRVDNVELVFGARQINEAVDV
jgi:hypothetical protein